MLLVPMSSFSGGRPCSEAQVLTGQNCGFPSHLKLSGHDMHTDCLRLLLSLFLVGVICPVMQEHFILALYCGYINKLTCISELPEDAMLKIKRPVNVLTNRSLHENLMHSGCHEIAAS